MQIGITIKERLRIFRFTGNHLNLSGGGNAMHVAGGAAAYLNALLIFSREYLRSGKYVRLMIVLIVCDDTSEPVHLPVRRCRQV